MIQWPATLPQKVEKNGYQEIVPDARIRTPMDMGPAKVRRRFTAQVRMIMLQMTMTESQVSTFDQFWREETAGGSLPFEFPDPRGIGMIEVRFGETPPEYGSFRGEHAVVNIELEVLP